MVDTDVLTPFLGVLGWQLQSSRQAARRSTHSRHCRVLQLRSTGKQRSALVTLATPVLNRSRLPSSDPAKCLGRSPSFVLLQLHYVPLSPLIPLIQFHSTVWGVPLCLEAIMSVAEMRTVSKRLRIPDVPRFQESSCGSPTREFHILNRPRLENLPEDRAHASWV